jgi:hypothetical protein
LITTGIGALVVALGFVIEAIINTNDAAEEGKPYVDNYGGAIRNSGKAADWAAGKYGIATEAVKKFNRATLETPTSVPFLGTGFAGLAALRSGATPWLDSEIIDPDPFSGAKTTASKITSALAPVSQALNLGVKKAEQASALSAKGFSEAYINNLFSSASTPIKAAKEAIKRATANTKFVTNQNKKAASTFEAVTAQRERDNQAQIASDLAAEQARAEAARKEAEALAERKRVLAAFNNSIISTFANIKETILNAFSLPELGGSTDSIIRNMDKLLVRVRAFSQNITKLSSMGLDPKLLQQVINAGPIAGAKLAANLVAGGAGGLATINRGFSELGGLSEEIGTTGTQALFGTQAQQQIYNVTINGGLDSGASIGKAVVDAIKAYERTSGVVFQGA